MRQLGSVIHMPPEPFVVAILLVMPTQASQALRNLTEVADFRVSVYVYHVRVCLYLI